MKIRKTTLIIFVLVLFAQVELARGQELIADKQLRILTINVWSGLNYQGHFKMGEYESPAVREKRYQALLTQIKQLDPDVIGVQEANKLPQYAKRLAKDTGYDAFFHVGVGGVRLGPIGLPWNLREGDAIFTKKYLNGQFAGRKQLSGKHVGNWATFHFSDATQVIAVEITFQNKPIYVFNTHWHASLPDSPEILAAARKAVETRQATEAEYENILARIEAGLNWRLSESEKTTAFIRETARNHPFVLMGDFNAQPGSKEIGQLIGFGMVDVFHAANPDSAGFTWNPTTNLNIRKYYLTPGNNRADPDLFHKLQRLNQATPRRIDYIFSGPESWLSSHAITIASCRVAIDHVVDGVQASDHFGVFARINFDK